MFLQKSLQSTIKIIYMKTTIKAGLAAILLLAISCKKENNVTRSEARQTSTESFSTDNDPGRYPSVIIGTQKWMVRNLDVAHYRNGDRIPQVKDPSKWAGLTTGAWCWYKNDSANGPVYGKLYNFYAVIDPRGLAPKGWHIPSYDEWDLVTTYLGGPEFAGGKMKDTGTIEAGTGLWYAPNADATNSTGFTGLPGGFRYWDGTFLAHTLGKNAGWWTSTGSFFGGYYFHCDNVDGYLYRSDFSSVVGMSVRCIKD